MREEGEEESDEIKEESEELKSLKGKIDKRGSEL